MKPQQVPPDSVEQSAEWISQGLEASPGNDRVKRTHLSAGIRPTRVRGWKVPGGGRHTGVIQEVEAAADGLLSASLRLVAPPRFHRLAELNTFAIHFEEMAPVGQPIPQCRRHPSSGSHRSRFETVLAW